MHNRTLNALQFDEITVSVSENSSTLWTIKWSSAMASGRTIAASAWSSEDSGLSISSPGFDGDVTNATFSASSPGRYKATNKITDDLGNLDERSIIFVFKDNSRAFDYGWYR